MGFKLLVECDTIDCNNTLKILRHDCPELYARNRKWHITHGDKDSYSLPIMFSKKFIGSKGR